MHPKLYCRSGDTDYLKIAIVIEWLKITPESLSIVQGNFVSALANVSSLICYNSEVCFGQFKTICIGQQNNYVYE